jgi:phenylpropionate dioxygenase-like ring-hydroxylating dioxygenase large terminal subunit
VTKRLEARHVEKQKVDWWYATILPTNWKLAMEAFMEGYHVMMTHPQLHKLSLPGQGGYGPSGGGVEQPQINSGKEFLDMAVRNFKCLSDGMAGMMDAKEVETARGLLDMKVSDSVGEAAMAFIKQLNEEITKQGRARGEDVPDLNQVSATTEFHAVEFMFPHYFLLPMFSAMSSYRIRPLGPETCLFEIWALSLHPEGEERDPPIAPAPMRHDDPVYPEIPAQDYSNLPLQQLGLHAKGFEYMRLSKDVEGMISNYQRLID